MKKNLVLVFTAIPIQLFVLFGNVRADYKDLHIQMSPNRATLVDDTGRRTGFEKAGDLGFQEIPGSHVETWTHQFNQRAFLELRIPSPEDLSYQLIVVAGPHPEPGNIPYDFSGEVTVSRYGQSNPDAWSIEGVRADEVDSSVRIELSNIAGKGLSLKWDGVGASTRAGRAMVGIKVDGPFFMSVSDRSMKRLGWGVTPSLSQGRVWGPLRSLTGGHWYSAENKWTGTNGTPREKVQWAFVPFVPGAEFVIEILGGGQVTGTLTIASWNGNQSKMLPEVQVIPQGRDKGFALKCGSTNSLDIQLRPLY